jgi:hypothetical protein
MVNMSVRQRYKLLQVCSDMDNGRLEDNSVVKPHILLKNSALDLSESNGSSRVGAFSKLCVQQRMCSHPKFNPPFLFTKSPLRPGIIADHKAKPISVKNYVVVVLEDCE